MAQGRQEARMEARMVPLFMKQKRTAGLAIGRESSAWRLGGIAVVLPKVAQPIKFDQK